MKTTPVSGGKSSTANSAIAIEFVDLSSDYQECLSIANYGIRGSGKTRLGATAPSEPLNGREGIGLVALDRMAQQTFVDVAVKQMGKRVIVPNTDLIRTSNPLKS